MILYKQLLSFSLFSGLALFLIFMSSCSSSSLNSSTQNLPTGIWNGHFKNDQNIEIPFTFEIVKSETDSLYSLFLINGEERLFADYLTITTDTIAVNLLSFASNLKGVWDGVKWEGNFHSMSFKQEKIIPFIAYPRINEEASGMKSSIDITGKYKVVFSDDSIPAIGQFKQNGSMVSGTFLTVTGDFRYLNGSLNDRHLKLSCFDGAHIFLFEAEVKEDGTLLGDFWSGSHYHVEWAASKDDSYELPDPNKLTYLKEGASSIDFLLPNMNKEMISLNNPAYNNKVVILQILGSWCPNCMDETNFLVPLHKKYQSKGLEIIGLAFERTDEFEEAKERLNQMKMRMGIRYEVLYAGTSDKDQASASLPMLNRVISYPTTIVMDREKNIRMIHTGFKGPGTGAAYTQWTEEFTMFIEKLLDEKVVGTNIEAQQ